MYRPALFASAKVHYVQTKLSIDQWEDVRRYVLVNDTGSVAAEVWDRPDVPAGIEGDLEADAHAGAAFASLPAELTRPKQYSQLATALKDHLYRHRTLRLWKSPAYDLVSAAGESEGDFRVRVAQRAREDRDRKIDKLRAQYAGKLATLEDRLHRAESKVGKEQSEASQETVQTAVSIGASLLRSLFGRKILSSTNVGRAATSARSVGRAARQRGDVQQAQEAVRELRRKYEDLEDQFEADKARIQIETSADRIPLEELPVQPRKADIAVAEVVLAWTPWSVGPSGDCQPAF